MAHITTAIFDCDGTLVDSMPMWNSLVEELLEEGGIAPTPELIAESEPYNFDGMCFWLHERFGIGESGEALLARTRLRVQERYRNEIQAFAGAREFLQELAQAGVRMVTLSATTSPEVRVALSAHGLEGFFDEIVSTAELGLAKEEPKAYTHMCERLGWDPASTWVFEDAPFALKSAHEAGFHTVCLFNEHDGRDFEFCQSYASIVAHGYGELSLARIRDYEDAP